MKKIININLSGRVIPIEDAAYESLQRYVESLRRYFAQEEGRDEIINDIESRMAELMNDKVKKAASAVTEADLNEIINAMGRVEDFEAAEAGAVPGATTESAQAHSQPFTEMKLPRGRLYRDNADKMIGGVCSGIANYLNIDPALIRILFVLMTFGAGMSILVYILLWIIIPSKSLEAVKTKRLFRNPDDRILGGVAGGIGAYLNKEPWVIRLIFAAPLLLNVLIAVIRGAMFPFHGNPFPNFFIGSFTVTFFITYVILWIILPEAKGTYEKMEMRGEHVDVNKIRQNVKTEMENFKTKAQSWGEEVKSTAQQYGTQAREFAGTQGRAFASQVGEVARPVGTGIGYVIVLLLKIFLIFILGCFALFFFLVLIFFLFGGVGELANDFLLQGPGQQFLGWAATILILGVPMMALITWLVRRIMKVRAHNRYLGWTFGSLWTIGLILGLLFAGTMVRSFRSNNESNEDVAITQPGNKMIVTVQDPDVEYRGGYSFLTPDDNDHNGWNVVNDSLRLSNVDVQVAKSEDSLYHITLWKYSNGSNRLEAENKARQIHYAVSSMDSIVTLANSFGISRNQKFRGQRVVVSVRVPVGKMIRFDESVMQNLRPRNVRLKENVRRFRSRNTYDIDWDFQGNFNWNPGVDYVMNADGELLDTSLPVERNEKGVYEYRRKNDTLKKEVPSANPADTTGSVPQKKEIKVSGSTACIATPVFSLII
jgi:phage shock protein PspC (stress-responsive transcriptional regulator)